MDRRERVARAITDYDVSLGSQPQVYRLSDGAVIERFDNDLDAHEGLARIRADAALDRNGHCGIFHSGYVKRTPER